MYSKEDLSYGDRLEINAIPVEIEGPRNEGEFDAKKYYLSLGIRYTLKDITIKNINPPNAFDRLIGTSRDRVSGIFEASDSEFSGIYKAMFIGDRSDLDEDIKDLYQASGIAHILAISGVQLRILGKKPP